MASIVTIRKKDRIGIRLSEKAAKRMLDRAFRAFADAAHSIEKSYGHLQSELERPRSKLERSNHELAGNLTDNAQMMRGSVEFLPPLGRQAGLRTGLQNGLSELEIAANAHWLQQMFFNLALNAFRALNAGGRLTTGGQRLDSPH